jgi:hypothetical protein
VGLLRDIADEAHGLDPLRRERGTSVGRWSSTIAARQAPVNLDAIVLRDPRTGVLAVVSHWAGRIRWHYRLPPVPRRSVTTEIQVLAEYWDWALRQPWGGRMLDELLSLREMLHQVRYGVPLRLCPVCGEPVRIDRFVVEHRACIDKKVGDP